MKKRKLKIPQVTFITGQSGAGKTTAAKELKKIYARQKVFAKILSTGNLIKNSEKLQTPFTEKIIKMYDTCIMHPAIVANSLIFNEISTSKKTNPHFIIEGLPRQKGQYTPFQKMVDAGLLKSILVIEVVASDKMCEERLIDRTKKDKRRDLSSSKKPDLERISKKLKPWNKNKHKVAKEIRRNFGKHVKVSSTGGVKQIKEELNNLF